MDFKILFTFLLFFGLNTQAQEINWMSFDEAIEAQEYDQRKIVVDFYTSWCGWCKRMDKKVFSNDGIASYLNENYYAVKFNAEGNEEVNYKDQQFKNKDDDFIKSRGRKSKHPFAEYLGVNGYPALVYFDEEANLIGPIPGYKSVKELELYLKMFVNDDHKKITNAEDFQEYQANFDYEIKE